MFRDGSYRDILHDVSNARLRVHGLHRFWKSRSLMLMSVVAVGLVRDSPQNGMLWFKL